MSRKDMVLLACGSRSMSSVRLPRRASAAARLMAVVVFPTPPFWLAMATITGRGILRRPSAEMHDGNAAGVADSLHFVLAEVVGIEALEPFVEMLGVRRLRGHVERLRVLDHRLLDEDRCARPERQRDRVARTRVDRERLALE